MKKNLKNKTAFTFIEVLIALVVSAILMTAMAVAFDASVKNYSANESLFRSTNMARQTLTRITNQVRVASSITLPGVEPVNKCTLITAEGQNITYDYRSANNALYLIDNGTSTEYLLCENISAMSFAKTVDWGKNIVKSVQVVITVTNSGQSKKLAGAALVRRNIE